ncbi:MAG: CotH kinase family protein [Saprospiraceae bacterium]
MLKLLLSAVLLLSSTFTFAQNSHPNNGKLFTNESIARIDIQMDGNDLNFILDEDNFNSDEHFPATFIFTNDDTVDTLENVGFRLRGNTTRSAAKKAFKVSFNTYEAGRKYRGVEKLNINPEKNDPTIARSHICWDLARQIGIPAARSNHIELYINGDYYGLYLNVEHIDENFVQQRFGNNDGNLYKCLFPADLVYKNSNPNSYKEDVYGRRAYDLKTNTDSDDYSDLAEFIDILNNAPLANLACELEAVFNVNDYLKAMAFDVLTGNWDGPLYNKNNFYLYHNTATDKFEYLPYDLDNTLGIDWLQRDWSERDIYRWARTSEQRPLFYRLIAVDEYKNRYSYYLQEFMEQYFNVDNLDYFIAELPEQLDPYIQRDEYYSADFGFSPTAFISTFTEEMNSFHVDYSIKNFIYFLFNLWF